MIESCRSVRPRGNTKASFVAVARAQTGEVVTGEFGWGKREYCESDIGDNVRILLNQNDSKDHRIFTFWEFFFIPLLLSVVAFVLYPLGYRAKKKHRQHKYGD